MADAMLEAAVNSPRDCDVLGPILTDMDKTVPTSGKGKSPVVHRQSSKSSTRHGSLTPGSVETPPSPTPGASTANPDDRLLAQVVQQGLRTEQLMANISATMCQLGNTMASLVNSDAHSPSDTTRGDAVSDDDTSDCGGNAGMEDLFADADPSAMMAPADTSADDDSGDLLDSVLQDYTDDVSLGPPIQQKLADAMNSMMFKKMAEGKLKDKLSAYPCPKNCEPVQISKINPEIWNKLNTQERSNDIRMQRLQAPVLKAVLPLLQITNDLLQVKNNEMPLQQLDVKKLATQAIDAISLLAHVNTELNFRRRDMLRPHLNKQFQQLCSPQTPMSTLLFGDNLAETIKSMSITNRVGKQVTSSYSQNRSSNYRPYQKPSHVSTPYRTAPYTAGRNYGNPSRGRGGFLDRNRPNYKKKFEGGKH